ncbi:nucleotidyltransferase [Lactonifactor sp. BIOML-A3]|uniref:nucleotidyltransferase family protein n=1 Tax=unclassified Lactonifactor TaxID=2636670 RepID=UPI0012AFC2E8|nr:MULTISPECIES: sugar phosphate nucleotidyltransferase [unclassified Lactonifactor]MSA03696.1 nucleotidyltransferase [Lactonifactor sp. BIOML-A5]MSA10153.1 nucleotidyltransferase [Lactonifactor sp. BIOML-A4]MSA14703.1 nucleotidyltransferase [Lactonifactor sp. BIOML-A3]MSA19125.1 nucleotidyltransferase [Lactonifactor sp. BIOML-A2]MSA39799.1 nucleotidyltransferase [Lactonifactor sp. BIOML-A1]
MKKTALVIMAAGIGSRFGGGVKQLAPVGPNGEIIMDYSIYDALEAGFNKVVFIIRKDLEKDFKEIIGRRIEKIVEVEYAYQELDQLPEGFKKPEDRTKPWGTGQAVLSAKELIKEPFAVINADDYYGKEAFVKVHDYLVKEQPRQEETLSICMAGFILGNTLSDNGSVTRGVCQVDKDSHLVKVTETHNIVKTEGGAGVLQEDGSILPLDAESYVSMNMWGLTPEFLEVLEAGFVEFLSELTPEDSKKEYLLPTIVDGLIREKRAEVTLLETRDTWFGVTYKEDKQTVVDAFAELIRKGIYKEKLFDN